MTDDQPPLILVAILAKQKAAVLPLYLRCIYELDYRKDRIILWVRTNNNTDATAAILSNWLMAVRAEYADVFYDDSDVPERVQDMGVHEWGELRYRVLSRLRQESLNATLDQRCDYYFVADCDNWIRPETLRELVKLDLPIVAPLLRHSDGLRAYSNLHYDVDANGYYRDTPTYHDVVWQHIRGVIEVGVVHCTYLVRADVIPRLTYDDGSRRWDEYVVFAHSARRAGVPQYFDNRRVYGYLNMDEDPRDAEALLLRPQVVDWAFAAMPTQPFRITWPLIRPGTENNSGLPTFCLCMIVRDEAHVILRCLESVKPLITKWCIVDTGSTDQTRELVERAMTGIPGTLHERPWVNFGHNRTEALLLAQAEGCDYTFVIDADEVLDIPEGWVCPPLKADAYMVTTRSGQTEYPRRHLMRSRLPWQYVGLLHEYSECAVSHTQDYLPGIRVVVRFDGARRRAPDTYRKDAELLQAHVDNGNGTPRDVFYLAQSYRDAEMKDEAIKWYEKRAAMKDGYHEEVFVSLYEIAKMKGDVDSLLRAWSAAPDRAEPLFHAAVTLSRRKDFVAAKVLFEAAMPIPKPGPQKLFVNAEIYDVLLPLEFAVVLYWLGEHERAMDINRKLLDGPLPAHHRDLVTSNLNASVAAVAKAA